MAAKKLFMKAFKYQVADSTASDPYFLQYMDNAFGQARFVWNQLKEYIDAQLKLGEFLPSRIDLNNYVNRHLKKQHKCKRLLLISLITILNLIMIKELCLYHTLIKSTVLKPFYIEI